jgi:hypothetical protein
MKRKPRIELWIDELALPAAPPGGEHRVREGIARELERLIERQGTEKLLRRGRSASLTAPGTGGRRGGSPESHAADLAARIGRRLMP